MAENDMAGEDAAIARVVNLAQAYWRCPNADFLSHGPDWNPDRWARVLRLEGLEGFEWKPEWEKISRELILGQWEIASSEESALQAFFLTMAWGFGADRFGRWKTLEMFKSMSEQNFGAYLLKVKSQAGKSPDDAYRSLLEQGIKQLGPVYASKLLYAMSPQDRRSPVMDMWIERWGEKSEFELDFTVASTWPIEKNVQGLKRFTDFCQQALNEVNTIKSSLRPESENDVGFVEYLIFWDAKYEMKKPWQKLNNFPAWVQDEMLK
jgi:hypothetical protein